MAAHALGLKIEDCLPPDAGREGYFSDKEWTKAGGSAENRRNSAILDEFVRQHLLSIRWRELVPGDVLVFSVKLKDEGLSDHVGIFVGDGRFVHATYRGVVQTDLAGAWLRYLKGSYRVRNG